MKKPSKMNKDFHFGRVDIYKNVMLFRESYIVMPYSSILR